MILKNKYTVKSHLIGGMAYYMMIYSVTMFKQSNLLWLDIISNVGLILFSYCGYILYIKKGARTQLLTTGVFKYTRHPMYTGVVLNYLIFLSPENYTIGFWIVTFIFCSAIIVGGYFQEKETIERFGYEAIMYYKKTPRLFFLYLLKFLKPIFK